MPRKRRFFFCAMEQSSSYSCISSSKFLTKRTPLISDLCSASREIIFKTSGKPIFFAADSASSKEWTRTCFATGTYFLRKSSARSSVYTSFFIESSREKKIYKLSCPKKKRALHAEFFHSKIYCHYWCF